jgi:hypothetical protein
VAGLYLSRELLAKGCGFRLGASKVLPNLGDGAAYRPVTRSGEGAGKVICLLTRR